MRTAATGGYQSLARGRAAYQRIEIWMRRRLSESPFTGMHGLALEIALLFLNLGALSFWPGLVQATLRRSKGRPVR